ncbi:alginate export family protein [Myxococcota bacterium]|nr:alginate export family protein [Myxococcota bacterium]
MGRKAADQLYVTQRARLGVAFESAAGLGLTFRLQDVRAWGEETHPLNDFQADGFDAHEAHLRVPLGESLKLTLGRQEIVFDNQRLVGNVNWRQSGQSFDAGRLTLKSGGFDADAFLAVVSESATKGNVDAHFPKPVTDDVLFGGLHAHGKPSANVELGGGYYLRKNDAVNELRHTAGLLGQFVSGGFKGSVEGYYQAGSVDLAPAAGGAAEEKTISAWLAAVRAGYDFGGTLGTAFQVFGEALSGKAGEPEKTFDTLYATNHMYYGELDYFLGIAKDTAGLGLMDVGARLGLSPVGGLRTTLDYHLFRSMDKGPGDKSDFGQEIDVKADWKALPGVNVGLLYGVFLPGELMQGLKGIVDDGDLTAEHALYLTTDASF